MSAKLFIGIIRREQEAKWKLANDKFVCRGRKMPMHAEATVGVSESDFDVFAVSLNFSTLANAKFLLLLRTTNERR